PSIKDLKSVFEGPAYTKWRSLRESEDSRYLGLTAPRFLARLPYDPTENPIKGFNYKEDISSDHDHYLWGNTAYLMGTSLTDSFAKY
ncbi:type VI secretion system contractile sheath domain-containing protein, partial [Aeromonas hydrophila]